MVFFEKIYKHHYVSQEINQAPWTKMVDFHTRSLSKNFWRSFFAACEIMQQDNYEHED